MTFIDSTGLGVIVGTLKRLREGGGDLVLRSPSRSTRKVLEITGLTRIVEIVEA
jgi:anti-sigma B factor antagonist